MKTTLFYHLLLNLSLLLSASSVLLCSNHSIQQPSDKQTNLFVEIYTLPDTSTSRTKVFVFFRLQKELFFLPSNEQKTNNNHNVYPVVSIEIRDKDNIIRANAEWQDTIPYHRLMAEGSAMGFTTFFVSPAEYSLYIGAGEKNLPKSVIITEQSFEIPSFTKQSVHTPICSNTLSGVPDTFFPLCVNQGISHWQNGEIIAHTYHYPEGTTFYYTIKPESTTGDLSEIPFRGEAKFFTGVTLKPIMEKHHVALRQTTTQSLLGLVRIPISSTHLEPGAYSLTLTNSSSPETLQIQFFVVWHNKPQSLTTPEYAVDMLRYIITDAEYDRLSSGKPDEVWKKLRQYWKNLDPTPKTSFNEAFHQYYYRVDVAGSLFANSSGSQSDGAKTDRGKVYVICGKPATIESRTGANKTALEIWRYAKPLNKEFIFEAGKRGEYRLVEENNLPVR